MESEYENVQPVEEDRLSRLSDELLHQILSSVDMKIVVRTCLFSSRWKLVWTSMPCLNFSSRQSYCLHKFARFVVNVLSHRNHQIQVSSVKLHYFNTEVSQVLVREIANYAFSHNVRELTVVGWPEKHHDFPPCLFSSHSLKHFTFRTCPNSPCSTPTTPWDFPALTTLYLDHIILCHRNTKGSLDLFSKCVNLKHLTMKYFNIQDVKVFDIITPRLSSLMLIDGRYLSKVINVIAPQLENLTIINTSIQYLNAPLGVSSLCYKGQLPIPLSKDRFHSLQKVNISLDCVYFRNFGKRDTCEIINSLQNLQCARYLTLNVDIIRSISKFPDLLSHLPSPFSNLICLGIDPGTREDAYKLKMSCEARNFFFDNSPNATFTMELPEKPRTYLVIHHRHMYVRKYLFTVSTAIAAIVDDSVHKKKNKQKRIQGRNKLSRLDAVMLIQKCFRSYLIRWSRHLNKLHELAVAKGELKDLSDECTHAWTGKDRWVDLLNL